LLIEIRQQRLHTGHVGVHVAIDRRRVNGHVAD
jgi:hypothetical protein